MHAHARMHCQFIQFDLFVTETTTSSTLRLWEGLPLFWFQNNILAGIPNLVIFFTETMISNTFRLWEGFLGPRILAWLPNLILSFYRNNDFEHFSALGESSPFLGSQNNILAGIPNLIIFCYRNDDLEHFSALGGSSSFLGFQNDILAGIPNLIIFCFFAWRLG